MTKTRNIKLHNPIEKHFDLVTPYHYYFFFLIFLSKVPIFWHLLNLIFLTPPIDYYCNKTETVTDIEDVKNKCPCDEPWWDRSVFAETIQTKYDLLCDKKWLVSFSQSMSYVGTLIGSFTFGYLSDKYGRLNAFTLSCLLLAVSGCLVSVMPTEGLFIFMRCLEGAGAGGAIVTGYVLCIEYCGVRHRETVTALFHLPINLSHLSLAGVSYLLRHCDEFQLALSIPMFLFVGMKWLVMESPKWLMDNGYTDKAANVMEKVSKFNRSSTISIKEEIENYNASKSEKSRRKIKFWHIFNHKRITLNLICMSIIYFVCGMGYYGVSQYIGKMSGNIHINVAIAGVLLVPGTIAALFLLKVLKRRSFLITTNFLSGMFMILVICIPRYLAWFRVIIACICNSFFFMSFLIAFLYGVELFPTSIRNSVLGFLSVLSRLGQIVAPPVNSLSENASACIFGCMAIVGSILCIPLPETKNVELPSTLEEAKFVSERRFTEESLELPETTQK